MGKTAAYCSECYKKLGKKQLPLDPQIEAAEKAGSTPMTRDGMCSKCSTSTVVIYYQS
jgi:hypothetical protein